MPPAYPRCACAVEYIEVENQKFENYLQDAETGYRLHDSQLIDLDFAGANMAAESEVIIWPEQGEKISKDEYRQLWHMQEKRA